MAAAPILPTPIPPTPQTVPLSQAARIVDTFIAPSKTLTDLGRNPSWWVPWLLVSRRWYQPERNLRSEQQSGTPD